MPPADADETPAIEYRLDVELLDSLGVEFESGLIAMLNNAGLASRLVDSVLLHLPDPSMWRLTISGDIVESVNRIERRDAGDAYTIQRGAGEVGARTINANDGSYDIVISAWAFMPPFEVQSPEELVDYMLQIGAHLAIHESGHVILHQRGEDSEAFQELASGTKTERSWRKHLAAHVDDFRIEKMANRVAQSPASNFANVGDTIFHMRKVLTESNLLRETDGDAAAFNSSTAVNDMIRVMTYLAAEVGGEGSAADWAPDPAPEGWDEYIAEVWSVWAATLDRLRPADESMSAGEIAAILSDLCRLVVVWSQNVVGYHYEMYEDNSWSATWYRGTY